MDPLLEELVKREVERTTKNDDPVIQRALNLLNQPMNPVRVVTPDDYASIGIPEDMRAQQAGAVAFRIRRPGEAIDPTLFVNRGSQEYDIATDPRNPIGTLMLAGALAHEQTHSTEGDEYPALRLEADFVRSKLSDLPKGRMREVGDLYLKELERLVAESRAGRK